MSPPFSKPKSALRKQAAKLGFQILPKETGSEA